MTSVPNSSQQSHSSSNESSIGPVSGRTPASSQGSRPQSRDGFERDATPSTSLSNHSNQEQAGNVPSIHQVGIGKKQTSGLVKAHLYSPPKSQPRPTSTESGSPYIPQAQKRTASGEVKQSDTSHPTSPIGTAQHGYSRNTSAASKASQVGDLSNELRTRLSYAMFKVQNGWQSHNITELEAMTPQRNSPTSNIHHRQSAGNSPTSRAPHPQYSPTRVQHIQGLSPDGSRSAYHVQQPQLSHPSLSPRSNHRNDMFRQAHASNGIHKAISPHHPLNNGPTLAPPVDILPRRSHTTTTRLPRLDTSTNPPKPTTTITDPFAHLNKTTLTKNSTPPLEQHKAAHLTTIRTPGQDKTAMEQDAVETLIFMSSPGNTGHYPAFHASASSTVTSPSNNINASPKRVGYMAEEMDRGSCLATAACRNGSRIPSKSANKALAVGRLTKAAEIDQVLDDMDDRYSSSDDDDDGEGGALA
ncbi:MAG: hypothetical protein Q9181_002117 [Wetmoreana brouardii]